MNRTEILAVMRSEFLPDELSRITVGAGAALTVLGGRDTPASDIDALVDDLEVLKRIARRRGIPLSSSVQNGNPRAGVKGNLIELFYDEERRGKMTEGIERKVTTVGGVRFDTPEVLVRWYEMMVATRGAPKDHENLAAAQRLLQRHTQAHQA